MAHAAILTIRKGYRAFDPGADLQGTRTGSTARLRWTDGKIEEVTNDNN